MSTPYCHPRKAGGSPNQTGTVLRLGEGVAPLTGIRKDKRVQDRMFSYVSLEQRVPQDYPLRTLRKLTDAVLRTPVCHRLRWACWGSWAPCWRLRESSVWLRIPSPSGYVRCGFALRSRRGGGKCCGRHWGSGCQSGSKGNSLVQLATD